MTFNTVFHKYNNGGSPFLISYKTLNINYEIAIKELSLAFISKSLISPGQSD